MQITRVQARQPPVISRLHWSVDHVCPHAGPVLVHEVSYRARQFVISGVFYRWREHGVFVKTSDDPASFRCRSRLRWSSALHGSFVLIQIPFPRKPLWQTSQVNGFGLQPLACRCKVKRRVKARPHVPHLCIVIQQPRVACREDGSYWSTGTVESHRIAPLRNGIRISTTRRYGCVFVALHTAFTTIRRPFCTARCMPGGLL